MFGKIVCGFFGGLMVTLLNGWVFGPLVILIPGLANSGTGFLFWGVWLLIMVLSVKASRTGRAWRMVFLTSAVLCFLMPLSAILLTGTLAANASGGGVLAIGSIIGMGGSILIASLFMVVFGLGFLVTGLLIGRKKKANIQTGEAAT